MTQAILNIADRHKTQIQNEVVNKLLRNREFMCAIGVNRKSRRLTPKLRKEIWEKFIERTDSFVTELGGELAKTFARQEVVVLANLRRAMKNIVYACKFGYTIKQNELFDEDEWIENFAEVSAPHILGGVTAGAIATLDRLDTAVQFNPDTDLVQMYVEQHAFANSLMLNETTDKALRKALADGLAEGESVGQVAKRVEAIFETAKKSRSVTIAQTEMIGAVNKGGNEGCKQSGVVWGTQWVGSLDNVIRESHEAMTTSEEAVALGEFFSNGCEYPGDQFGPAEESINCRCTLLELTEKP